MTTPLLALLLQSLFSQDTVEKTHCESTLILILVINPLFTQFSFRLLTIPDKVC